MHSQNVIQILCRRGIYPAPHALISTGVHICTFQAHVNIRVSQQSLASWIITQSGKIKQRSLLRGSTAHVLMMVLPIEQAVTSPTYSCLPQPN